MLVKDICLFLEYGQKLKGCIVEVVFDHCVSFLSPVVQFQEVTVLQVMISCQLVAGEGQGSD